METKRNQYKNYYAIRYNFEPKKRMKTLDLAVFDLIPLQCTFA